jgi:hypothetical protein
MSCHAFHFTFLYMSIVCIFRFNPLSVIPTPPGHDVICILLPCSTAVALFINNVSRQSDNVLNKQSRNVL